MWRRWISDLSVRLHWAKSDIMRRWRLDAHSGTVGILVLISGLLLFIIIGDAVAHAFRAVMPWVAGTQVSEIYWQSIGFGIKTSFLLLLFIGSLMLFLLLKFFDRQ